MRLLHQRLWRVQKEGSLRAEDLIAVLDPANAAAALGVTLEYVDQIPASERAGFRTAGMLDRQQRRIYVSKEFSLEEQRFTAAHEIGHFALHKQQTLFRDRPLSGTREHSEKRPAVEAEADHFGACLLMPPNLLRRQVELTFRVKTPFVFNDSWAFELARGDADTLLYDEDALLNRAFAMAAARSFNSRHVRALHEQFRVSVSAMAYRLLELGLVGTDAEIQTSPLEHKSRPTYDPLLAPGVREIEESDLDAIFVAPFAQSARRRELLTLFRGFIAFIRQIGIDCEIWIDGSFATRKPDPRDIDVAVFILPRDIGALSYERRMELELLRDRPLMAERYACDVYIEPADDLVRRAYYRELFGEYKGIAKGIPALRITSEL